MRLKMVRMKKIMLYIAICLMAQASHAQTWEEWFRQKKTQKKYLSQQIAALRVYLDYAKKGYDLAGKGINTIHTIKQGDFDLHKEFFNSLLQVNPAIKNYGKVAHIISYQVKIIHNAKQTVKDILDSRQFTPAEIDYCTSVFDFLFAECNNSIDELTDIVTSGVLEMKDVERLKQIDRIYLDLQEKYSFCCSFAEQIGLLSFQRQGEQLQINRSKRINGIK